MTTATNGTLGTILLVQVMKSLRPIALSVVWMVLGLLSNGCGDEVETIEGSRSPGVDSRAGGPQIVKGPPKSSDVDGETHLALGRLIPDFKAVAIDGRSVESKALRGRNVLIVLFSTTCRSCRAELRFFGERLDASSKRLVTIAVGRENTKTELVTYRLAEKHDFVFIPDPKRALYELFASARVPRTYLFDEQGKLVHQTRDFSIEQGEETLRHIDVLLKQPR